MTTPHTSASRTAPHGPVATTYFRVFVALLLLTALTVGVSYLGLGRASAAVALVIAVIKAALVASVFMHLWYDNRFYLVIFVVAIVFLMLFLVFPLVDMGTRGRLLPESGQPVTSGP